MCNKPTILRELMSASILLALASSLLYLAGIFYVNAYLTEWGVESTLIKSDVQSIMVHGVGVLYIGGIYTVSIGLALGIVLHLYLSIALGISKWPFVRKIVTKLYNKYKENQPEKIKTCEAPVLLQSSVQRSLQLIILGVFLSFFLILFSWFLEFSKSLAVDRAQKEYSEFSSGKSISTNLFSRKKLLTINGAEKEGYILANSDSLVVLYLLPSKLNKEKVIIIPLSSITEIKAVKVAT